MPDGVAQDVRAGPAQFDGYAASLGSEVEEELGRAEVSSRHGVVGERPAATLSCVDEVCAELVDQPATRQDAESEVAKIQAREQGDAPLGDIVFQLDVEEIHRAKVRQSFLPKECDACDESSGL